MVGQERTAMTRCLALLALLVGCSDYNFAEKADPGLPGGDPLPNLSVDPAEVALAGVCGVGSETVTLSNTGEGPLTVTAILIEGDWSGVLPETPLTLGATEAVSFVLGGVGAGRLVVESDDPDSAVTSVPLSTGVDSPPTLSLSGPSDGSTLGPELQQLVGTVGDAEDEPESLVVRFESDVDGLIGEAAADGSGLVTLDWPEGRSPGPQVVTATVTDSCGNTVTDTLTICQQAGYTSDAIDIASWHFEGSARWDADNSYTILTEPYTEQVGSAFQTTAEVSGDNVQIEFLFYIGGGSGADGLSLTALDTMRMTSWLGGSGCGIGYGGDASCTLGPALPGWSIEVDTFYNEGQDPTPEDHLMFTFDGDVDDPAIWAVLPEMEDTGWHQMTVEVVAPNVRVNIDGVDYIDQALSGTLNFPAYVGFTAGTGGLTNNHLIDALQVTDYVCPE
jgi:hypothetical protein